MAYKYKGRLISVGSSWIDDEGFTHPYDWASKWSSDDLKKWGVSVEADTDNSFDSRFYSSKDVERSLADTDALDPDTGEKLKDPTTGEQVVIMGLKNEYINKTKTTAHNYLVKTDWYITRKAEDDKAIPSKISTYRAAVKTAASNIETKINACSDLAAFKVLFQSLHHMYLHK